MDDFDLNVFINCPFDDDYSDLLQAILFCVVVAGLRPRLATERGDSGETRLDKIRGLIEQSRWSNHDLSRCQARQAGEMLRLNMPFELGIDWGCRRYFGQGRDGKRFLILEEQRYRFQAALSDISGCDIEAHGADYRTAMVKVRNWLRLETQASLPAPAKLLAEYEDFVGWHYLHKLSQGFSELDIRHYPTFELLESMGDWMKRGRPKKPKANQ